MDVRAALLDLERAHELPHGGRRYVLPATPLAALGDPGFCRDVGIRLPYVAGAMANGIASVGLVTALGRAGLVGFYGAAGQAPATVEGAIQALRAGLGDRPFGVNLIHSPSEPELEARVADLLVERGVRLVEASAYLALTLPLVRYRLHGIHRGADGRVVTPNRVVGKVSRIEVATQFLSPAPAPLVGRLVELGHLTPAQAEMAREVPVAQDVTVEADSGGHTDNRPLVVLLPLMLALKARLQGLYGDHVPLRIGAAGGLATPAAVAGAFAMGAAYVVTGSVNQACVESGTSPLVRSMLARAGQADFAMAPAADMFEMGVKVQVLKQGTMFPMRAAKLYELYQKHRTLEDLPAKDREQVETQLFRASLGEVWEATKRYFAARDPRQCERGDADPRHRMALVFRSYLGQSSHWANQGVEDRRLDYQVWCGPAMGAFNEWAKGTFLEAPAERRAVTVALNLLFGAAVLGRARMLRAQGFPERELPGDWRPLPEAALRELLETGGRA